MRKATRTAAVLALVATCNRDRYLALPFKYVVDQLLVIGKAQAVESSIHHCHLWVLAFCNWYSPNDLIDDNLRRLNYGAKRVFSLPNCQELVVSWRIDGIEQAMPTTHQLKQLNAVLEDVPVHSVHLHIR